MKKYHVRLFRDGYSMVHRVFTNKKEADAFARKWGTNADEMTDVMRETEYVRPSRRGRRMRPYIRRRKR